MSTSYLLIDKNIETKFIEELNKEMLYITYHPYVQSETPDGKPFSSLNTDSEITFIGTTRKEFIPEGSDLSSLLENPKTKAIWDVDAEKWKFINPEQVIDFSVVRWSLSKKVAHPESVEEEN